jgi:hypothetical protein
MAQGRISRLGQVNIYVGKCFRAFVNENGWKSFVSAAAIAIIISWVAGENTFVTFKATRSGAFALVCACIWTGVFNSIQSICRERAIIKREHRTGLHITSYIAAHMVYEMMLCFAEALITVVILFVVRDCPEEGVFMPPFLELFLTFFLVIFASDALGMAVSCVVKTETAAMTAMPFVLILQLVLCGVIFELPKGADLIAKLTVSKWGVNAICSIANVNAMSDAALMGNYNQADYEFLASHLANMWLILAFFVVLYGAVGVISLKFIDRDKR